MSDPHRLEIGLCWGTLQNASLTELIEAAGRHGFPTVSVRPDMIVQCVAAIGAAGVRRHLCDSGVRVRMIDALAAGLPGMEAATERARLSGGLMPADEETCFRVAEVVECPIINVPLFGGETAARTPLAEAIGATSARAEIHGLEIVLEFVPGTTIPDIAFARGIVEACGAPNCKILLDPWHLVRSGGGLEDILALPPDALGAFQLDDRIAPPPGPPYVPMTGRELPGKGELPLRAMTRAALVNNPALTIEIEVFSAELRALPIDAAVRVAGAVVKWGAEL